MPSRNDMWEKLEGSYDLLVVGGGITGAGIARDAARRGLRVALVEMADLASGTSSRSSKLVHGGLRYLEHYEFSLVFEAVSERRILMDLAPHLVNPLGFLFPVYDGSPHKLWLINAGMWLYDGLSLFRSPKIHKKLSAKQVETVEPALNQERLKGAPLYYDCSTDDARLTLETALDAIENGATFVTWCKAARFLKQEDGRLAGAVVRDEFTGEEKEIHARAIINATGPWTDRTVGMSSEPPRGELLRPTKGIHIVVDYQKLPVNHAVVCFHPEDQRVLFAVPWGDRTYVGTTDTDYQGDPGEVAANSDDVDYLVDAANAYFPEHPLSRSDVISTWAGIRPLMAPPSNDGVSESSVSREHQIVVGRDGLITIAGGKLTTYRRMAAEVVDTATRLLQMSGFDGKLVDAETDKHPLPGGVGWPEDDDHDKVAAQVTAVAPGLSQETARYLADAYGMRSLRVAELAANTESLAAPLVPGRPEILAQVDIAVTEELSYTIADFMIRRTQLFYRDVDQGLEAVTTVAARMAELLDWSDTETASQIRDYEDEVARSRAWKATKPITTEATVAERV
ncbi:MAG: glycerol-3-phosphate dehydrogenase [Myxococcota bacterium]